MSRFSSSAPSADIPFPPHAKITAVELFAFLPRSLHSSDVVYRLVSNEFRFKTIATIINFYRAWEPDVFDVRKKVSTTMISTMREGGYEDWKLSRHSKWHKHRKSDWDKEDLNVGAFKTPLENNVGMKKGRTPSIAFKDLAPDSGKLPEGDDALDLTRMVRYATEHPDETWTYPQDYDRLLAKVGGPTQVRTSHSDIQALERWIPVTEKEPKSRGYSLIRKKRKERSASPLTMQVAPSKKRKVQNAFSVVVDAESEGVSGDEDDRAPSIETARDALRYDIDVNCQRTKNTRIDTVKPDEPLCGSAPKPRIPATSYSRPLPAYYDPPIIENWPSDDTERELNEEFRLYGNLSFFDESHAYAADAFNGPRYEPPYRLLCHIDNPKADNISGWAENLRWAREQGNKFHVVGWTESPVDMKHIWKIRKEQGWLSEECVAAYVKEEAREGVDWRLVIKAGWATDGYVCGKRKR